MVNRTKFYIDGAWVDPAVMKTVPVVNPATEERIALLEKIIDAYKARSKEIAAAISDEMGAPIPMAERAQAGAGLGHLMSTLQVLKDYHFEEKVGTATVVREPIGVVGMITPWNWPLNQIACKVAPAIAAGCTMILKPSEFTPTSALIFAEVMHAAGVPKGVFNLVNGLVHVRLRADGDVIHGLFGCRIDHRDRLHNGGVDPGAVDIEFHAIDHLR